jgi:Cys-rich repeat protein
VCQCKVDSDCASTSYCSVGFLGAGKNQCVAKGAECASCDSDSKCQSGFCSGKPLGKCATASSKSIGASCCRNDQCRSGSCNSDGVCQCKSDSDCGSGSYCSVGFLGAGKNQCLAKSAECASCDSDSKCASGFCAGKPLGKCATRNSKSVGQTCCRNDQCTSGQCASDKCVCTEDRHCPSGQKCKKPLVGTNHCE